MVVTILILIIIIIILIIIIIRVVVVITFIIIVVVVVDDDDDDIVFDEKGDTIKNIYSSGGSNGDPKGPRSFNILRYYITNLPNVPFAHKIISGSPTVLFCYVFN